MKVKGQMSESNIVMTALTLSGGLQDAYSYFVRGKVFANAQTGNLVLLSDKIVNGDFTGTLKYLVPILAFTFGIFVAEQLKGNLQKARLIHWRQIVVLSEIIMLFIVGLLPISKEINPIANALTSFSCAMQVQAFRKVKGHPYASTMCIGNIRSAMETMSAYIRTRDLDLLKKSLQYILVIFIFLLGAGFGGAFYSSLNGKMIWFSCFLLILAFVLMFKEEEI